ncbi:putative Ecdysone-induced protein 78C [Hypsibius exemplaris]|uniref:Ecdysone-induced protein 78C n=1 Tax=Hypsibius exemplaris TaxID=2072580 RepID=A0A1W0X0H2_HYPEX|nr:putative Ecdysone-induced protein 78C [Hypsibius exemplaris]
MTNLNLCISEVNNGLFRLTTAEVVMLSSVGFGQQEASSSSQSAAGAALNPAKCRVCGCRSTGVHYGVIACEGCKAFYKRGLLKQAEYKCYFGGTCVVGPTTGGRCKSCRFNKCVQAGMNLQATKMGRTPKRKPVRSKSIFDSRPGVSAATFQDPSGVRRIAPASVVHSMNGVFAISREKNYPEWTSPLQAQPSRPHPYPQNSQHHHPSQLDTRPDIRLPSSTPFSSHGMQSELEAAPSKRPHQLTSPVSSSTSTPSSSASSGLFPREPTGIARFSPDTLWNIRGFYIDSSSLGGIDASCSSSELLSGLTEDLSENTLRSLPSFLAQYWRVIRDKKLCVESTMRTVHETVHQVFGDRFRSWDHFMCDAIVNNSIPYQPQVTILKMLQAIRDDMEDSMKRQCRFLFSLPGFSELDASDQRTIVSEKYLEMWFIVHSPYITPSESYFTLGPEDEGIHFSKYWAKQLFAVDYCEKTQEITAEIRGLRLSNLELFLLLAVASVNPDTTTAKNKTILSFLHAHYLDCLLTSVRSRQSLAARTATVEGLLQFLSKLRSLFRLGNIYFRALDFSRVPFRAIVDGGILITVNDALTTENDGLTGPTRYGS